VMPSAIGRQGPLESAPKRGDHATARRGYLQLRILGLILCRYTRAERDVAHAERPDALIFIAAVVVMVALLLA